MAILNYVVGIPWSHVSQQKKTHIQQDLSFCLKNSFTIKPKILSRICEEWIIVKTGTRKQINNNNNNSLFSCQMS